MIAFSFVPLLTIAFTKVTNDLCFRDNYNTFFQFGGNINLYGSSDSNPYSAAQCSCREVFKLQIHCQYIHKVAQTAVSV